jgi:hypothetical protein
MFYKPKDFYKDELDEFRNLSTLIRFGTVRIDSESQLKARFMKGKETPFLKYFSPGSNKKDEHAFDYEIKHWNTPLRVQQLVKTLNTKHKDMA